MKNSPHHKKHVNHKEVRASCHLELRPKRAKKTLNLGPNFSLKPINTDICKRVLNLYKHHLEKARLHRSSKASKRATPGEIEKGPFKMNQLNPKKISNKFKLCDLQRAKKFAKKMLKRVFNSNKKAA
jgi:hypothetical protein